MSWVNSLTPADIEELENALDGLGPELFEEFVMLALCVRLTGAIDPAKLDDYLTTPSAGNWQRLSVYFELRADGLLHIKGAQP